MKVRSTASGATAAIVPGAVIVGVGLLVSSVAGLRAERDHYRAEAAEPRPTATVTASPPAGVRRSPHPVPSSSVAPTAGTLLAAGEPARGAGSGSVSGTGGVSGSGSGPASPVPSPEPPASSSRGGVSVRLPLGVLPRVGVHVTIGGRK